MNSSCFTLQGLEDRVQVSGETFQRVGDWEVAGEAPKTHPGTGSIPRVTAPYTLHPTRLSGPLCSLAGVPAAPGFEERRSPFQMEPTLMIFMASTPGGRAWGSANKWCPLCGPQGDSAQGALGETRSLCVWDGPGLLLGDVILVFTA